MEKTESEKKLDEYVERYCQKHRITPEEAKEHKLVQEVKSYYDEKYK